jgi:hypothetical protein
MRLPLDPSIYSPPQITETDEPHYTDCTWCAGLGLVACWTTGEAVLDLHWRPLSEVRLRARREALRAADANRIGRKDDGV